MGLSFFRNSIENHGSNLACLFRESKASEERRTFIQFSYRYYHDGSAFQVWTEALNLIFLFSLRFQSGIGRLPKSIEALKVSANLVVNYSTVRNGDRTRSTVRTV